MLSALPLAFALILIVFFLLVFNDDTPISMVERKCDEAKVYRFMNRLYNDYRLMEDRIKEIYKKIDESGGETGPKAGCC